MTKGCEFPRLQTFAWSASGNGRSTTCGMEADRRCKQRFVRRTINLALPGFLSETSDSVRSSRFYVIAISAVAALGGFLFGFDSGVINGTVDALNRAFHASNLGSGFNVASLLLGCAAGAFIAGALADKAGRRAVLIVAAILFVWGSWGSGIAHGSMEFIVYRVMGGLAVGAASIICRLTSARSLPPGFAGAWPRYSNWRSCSVCSLRS